MLSKNNVEVKETEVPGTLIYVAKNGQYIGCVLIGDSVRDRTKILIKKLDTLGIKTILLSGDKFLVTNLLKNRVKT